MNWIVSFFLVLFIFSISRALDPTTTDWHGLCWLLLSICNGAATLRELRTYWRSK